MRPGRGLKAALDTALAATDIKEGELVYAKDEDKLYMVEGGVFVAAGGGGGAVFIDDLSDVDTSTVAPTDGQVLTWVDANSQWEPVTSSGGGAAALPDLTDVKDALDSGGLGLWDTDTGGQFPAANGAWRCYAVNSPDILQFYKFNAAGVDQSSYLLSLVSGNTIRISNDNSTWNDITLLSDATYSAGGGGNTVINMGISDADGTLINGLGGSVYVALPPAPYATDGQVLTYVAANGQWEPAALGASPLRAALGIGEYVDDAAADAGGVVSGAIYYNTTSSDYRLKT